MREREDQPSSQGCKLRFVILMLGVHSGHRVLPAAEILTQSATCIISESGFGKVGKD